MRRAIIAYLVGTAMCLSIYRIMTGGLEWMIVFYFLAGLFIVIAVWAGRLKA